MHELHFNKTQCFEDFTNHIALLLWEGLLQEKDLTRPDPHRFPGMSQALHRVIQHRVGICPVCSKATHHDDMLTTSKPTAAHSCRDHAVRLNSERGPELRELMNDVEKKTVDFLARHDTHRAHYKCLPDKVHHAVDKIKTYLYENIACSQCSGH